MLPLATALATLALGASSFESYVQSHNTPQFSSRSSGKSSSPGDKTVTHRWAVHLPSRVGSSPRHYP